MVKQPLCQYRRRSSTSQMNHLRGVARTEVLALEVLRDEPVPWSPACVLSVLTLCVTPVEVAGNGARSGSVRADGMRAAIQMACELV